VRAVRRVIAITVMVPALALTACAQGGGGIGSGLGRAAGGAPDSGTSAAPSAEPPTIPAPTTAPPPATTPAGRPTPTRSKSPTRRPSPAKRTETKLPPPPKTAPATCPGPKYVGTAATRAQVKAALEAAASKTYWPTSAPSIRVPVELVKAVAWQESGWQSHILACDSGTGLMQVMPDTAAFVNQRFGQSYDINDYQENAILGANYLAWLIKYFGDVYFQGSYDLSVRDPDAPVLLDAVVAAYNVGPGAVDTAAGLVIPNRGYVNNVEALMTNCVCLDF
jgi:hypothetical protein